MITIAANTIRFNIQFFESERVLRTRLDFLLNVRTRTEFAMSKFMHRERVRLSFVLVSVLLICSVFAESNLSPAISSASSSSPESSTASSNLCTSPNLHVTNCALIWLFGYIGDTFYPKSELGLLPSAVTSIAKSLSESIGKQNLVLLSAVDQVPVYNSKGICVGCITSSEIPTVQSYVAKLHKYATAVYGRLDMFQFNLTALGQYGNCEPTTFAGVTYPGWANCPLYNQSRLYLTPASEGGLGLNGIWFDHVLWYLNYGFGLNNTEFNIMMQNLTDLNPNSTFILNHTTPPTKWGYITELPEYTWGNQSYVAPSPSSLSGKSCVDPPYFAPAYCLATINNQLQQENVNFPGHVIMHLDAAGPPTLLQEGRSIEDPNEPMSTFANMTSLQESSALSSLVYNGTHPVMENETYGMVIPIIGSWTYNGTDPPKCGLGCPNYNGTLYDSLSNNLVAGTEYARGTFENFMQILLDCEFNLGTCSA